MRKIKSISAVILAVFLIAAAIPFSASAAEVEGAYEYIVTDGQATITDVDENLIGGDITVPDTLGGYPVTEIDSYAFYDCSFLTSVIIPDSIKDVSGAFVSCSRLTEVIFGSGVTSIDGQIFSDCQNLKYITVSENNKNYCSVDGVVFSKDKSVLVLYPLGKSGSYIVPDGTVEIGENAFQSCDYITGVIIPDSVTTIGNYAFYGSDLKSVTIGNGVSAIGDHTFQECNQLINVTIGTGIKTIGYCAFDGCTNLKTINIPGNVETIVDSAFSACGGLTNVTISNGVKTIGSCAFVECTSLTEVTIPESVTTIERAAFDRCISLKNITVAENNKNYCDIDGAVFSKDKTALLIYPNGKEGSYVITDGTSVIESHAFLECVNLTDLTIPKSVTSIINGEFAYMSQKITIFCYKDSYADKYAQRNGLKIKYLDKSTVNTVKTSDGKFIVTAKDDFVFDSATKLVVKEASKTAFEAQFKGAKITAFDVTLQKNGKEIQPSGKVEVSMAVPSGYDGKLCKVYRAEESGKYTDMKAVYQDGKMVFTADHFSVYIIEQKNDTETPVSCTHSNTKLQNGKDATCTQDGYTGDEVCADCGKVVQKGVVIAKTGHTFKDGKCTICGIDKSNSNSTSNNPKTGDNSDIGIFAVMMFISATGILSLACYKKRELFAPYVSYVKALLK